MFYKNIVNKITFGSLLTFMALGFWTVKTEQATATADQTDVSVELMLSIDVSSSVDTDEYNLQMDGYAAAFRDSEVISAIESLPDGLAVGVQFWASFPAPAQPWRVIRTAQQSRQFADYLDALNRPSNSTTSIYTWFGNNLTIGGSTNVTGAIAGATDSIMTNQYNGNSKVIDVSGDGKSNSYQLYGNSNYDSYGGICSGSNTCQAVMNIRDIAVSQGITINGLPIEPNDESTVITDYFTTHVKGGTNGFVETASGFDDFTRAAVAKIRREIDEAGNRPVANPDLIVTNEDSVGQYNVIAGDPSNNNAGQDTDPNGDSLTVTKFVVGTTEYTPGTQVTMPSGAILNIGTSGDVTYDPNGQFESMTAGSSLTTQDTFTYTVSDGRGNSSSAVATLDINGVADNPNAIDDTATTDEDTSETIDVLENDSDPDTPNTDLRITHINDIAISVDNPVRLTSGDMITLNADNTLSYDPSNNQTLNLLNDGQQATTTFTYTLSDLNSNTDRATVTVRVTGITDTYAD